jgi:hypothetical protein
MRRKLFATAALAAAPLLGGAASLGTTPPELESQGWRKVEWSGLRPASFSLTPQRGIRIQAQGQASFIARPVNGIAGCLAWRWRVESGPPPTDLTRRGGDDRAIAISVGFAGFGPQAGFALRTQHAIAQASVSGVNLPRSALVYVWGGTGQEGAGRPQGFFPSPWSAGLSQLRVLRPAAAPRGQWFEEKVDLGADWRAAFGGAEVPPMVELAILTDSDDTGARVEAQVENLRLVPCR